MQPGEHYAKYGRKCYQKNKDKYRPVRKRWSQENREKMVKYVQAYVARNKQSVAEYNKAFSTTLAGKYRGILYRHKQRAWSEAVLTLEEFEAETNKPCRYCGEPANYGLDRVDNTQGYTVTNVVSCCELCNHMKWNLPQSNFLEHVKKISSHI